MHSEIRNSGRRRIEEFIRAVINTMHTVCSCRPENQDCAAVPLILVTTTSLRSLRQARRNCPLIALYWRHKLALVKCEFLVRCSFRLLALSGVGGALLCVRTKSYTDYAACISMPCCKRRRKKRSKEKEITRQLAKFFKT